MAPWVLTLSRLPLAAAFAVVVAVAAPGPVGAGTLVALLALAAAIELTDLLDGWAARRFGAVTELGGLVDPLCDSLSRLTMFYAAALAGWVWLAVPLVMTGRDILVAYVRIVCARTGRRTAARVSGKLKALIQALAVFAVILAAGDWLGARAAVKTRAAAGVAVIVVTAWSLVDYLRAGWPAAKQMMAEEA